jgi:hypothetical protein
MQPNRAPVPQGDRFSGKVTKIRSNGSFDIVAGGKTYNVYTNGSTRSVRVGESVRIVGQRQDKNDIRNAVVLNRR